MAVNQRRNFSDFCKKPMRSDKNRTSPIEIHSDSKYLYKVNLAQQMELESLQMEYPCRPVTPTGKR